MHLHESDGVGVVVRVGDERAALLAQVCRHGVRHRAQTLGHARQQLVHARQLCRARVHQHVHHTRVLHLHTRTNTPRYYLIINYRPVILRYYVVLHSQILQKNTVREKHDKEKQLYANQFYFMYGSKNYPPYYKTWSKVSLGLKLMLSLCHLLTHAERVRMRKISRPRAMKL
jgi:hypothetical protein